MRILVTIRTELQGHLLQGEMVIEEGRGAVKPKSIYFHCMLFYSPTFE